MKTNRTPEKIAAGMTLGVVLFLGTAAAGAYEAGDRNRELSGRAAQAQDPELAFEAAQLAAEREWRGDQFRGGALLAGCLGAVVMGGVASMRRAQHAVEAPVHVAPTELTIEAQFFAGNDYVAGNQARTLQTV